MIPGAGRRWSGHPPRRRRRTTSTKSRRCMASIRCGPVTSARRANCRMDNPRAGRGLRALAVGTAAAIYGLIVVGAIVRSTGSGMGCGDHWPLCNGYLIPLFDLATFIEWSHRLAAAVATVMLFSTTLLALKNRRTASRVIRPLTAASVLLVCQIILCAITVKAALLPSVVALHLGTALIIFSLVLYSAVLP